MSQERVFSSQYQKDSRLDFGIRPTSSRKTNRTSPRTVPAKCIRWIGVPLFLAFVSLSVPAFGSGTVTSITPASAYPGETVNVTFSGRGLSGTTAVSGWGACVTVSNVVATDTRVTASFHLEACTLVETHILMLVTSGGNTNSVSFQVLAPTVTGITPASAYPGETVNVTFRGSGLSGTNAVSGWGSCVTVSNVVATNTTVTATFGIGTCGWAGTHTLTLTTSGGSTNSVSFQVMAPTVTGITPASAYPGEKVNMTFSGSGLSGTTAVNGWGSCVSVSKLVATDTSVTATFSLGTCASVGTHTLMLVTPDDNTNSVLFQVLAPTVATISPATGVLSSSVNVTFSGHGLSGTSAVNGWGSCVTVSNLVATDTSVKATFNIENCALGETHTLSLVTPDGNTNTASFQVLAPKLSVSSSSMSFGDQPATTAATQTLTLTSTGTEAVTVSAGSVSGTGFSMPGATFPVTLNSGVAIKIQVQFDPPSAATDTGSITFSSNSSTGSTTKVVLSGTGTPWVKLTWTAPSNSPDPVSGYNVYRALSGSSSYQQLNSPLITQTTYYDQTVESGSSYAYYVESVDSEGARSAPSNEFTVAIP